MNSALSDRKSRYSFLENEQDMKAVNAILKSYTEQSFIYSMLNEALRNEQYEEI